MERSKPPSLPTQIPRESPHAPDVKTVLPEGRPTPPPMEGMPSGAQRTVFPDVTIPRGEATIARPDLSISDASSPSILPEGAIPRPSLGAAIDHAQQFKDSANAIDNQIKQLKWYQKIPGFSAKPELVKQHALHTEAADSVRSPTEAALADALLKLPPKNRPDSIRKALEMTRAGEELLPEVASGQRGPRDATPERAAQLQWALYNKAIQQLDAQAKAKGAPREQLIGGMTVLEDGGKVAQFMQAVQRPGTGKTASYTRPSSHFKETRDSSLGLDFKDPNIPLPAGKKTSLYGTKDGGKSSYVKNEYSGYDTLGDRFGHIFDFIKTNILGQREVGRREKFIPKDVKDQYKEIKGPPLDPNELKAKGIAYMIESLPANKQGPFAKYVADLGYNNPKMRKGEEIIVPQSQLGIPPDSE